MTWWREFEVVEQLAFTRVCSAVLVREQLADLGVLVRGVVVHHQVQLDRLSYLDDRAPA